MTKLLDARDRVWLSAAHRRVKYITWIPSPTRPPLPIRGRIAIFPGSSNKPAHVPVVHVMVHLGPCGYSGESLRTISGFGGGLVHSLIEVNANHVGPGRENAIPALPHFAVKPVAAGAAAAARRQPVHLVVGESWHLSHRLAALLLRGLAVVAVPGRQRISNWRLFERLSIIATAFDFPQYDITPLRTPVLSHEARPLSVVARYAAPRPPIRLPCLE